jgi:AraC family transcriptional regulator of arabinose operon
MEIVNVGCNYRHSADFLIDRPHGSGDYILLVIKTEAFIVLGGERRAVAPSSAVVFRRGTPQLYGATAEEYINDWIHFDLTEEEDARLCSLGVAFDTVLPLRETGELSDLIHKLFLERYSQNLYKELSMQRYFDLIFLKLAERSKEECTPREHPLYGAFLALRNEVRLAPWCEWSIDNIARKMNLSRSYVQHLYKSFFGTGILADVQACRMEYARHLLSSTDISVSAVAESCGYENDVHFMRIFKKATGQTPSEFRRKFRISSAEVQKSVLKPPFAVRAVEKSEE